MGGIIMKKFLLTLLTLLILGVSIENIEVHAEDELPGMRNSISDEGN